MGAVLVHDQRVETTEQHRVGSGCCSRLPRTGRRALPLSLPRRTGPTAKPISVGCRRRVARGDGLGLTRSGTPARERLRRRQPPGNAGAALGRLIRRRAQPAPGRTANDRGNVARLPQRRLHPVGRTGALQTAQLRRRTGRREQVHGCVGLSKMTFLGWLTQFTRACLQHGQAENESEYIDNGK